MAEQDADVIIVGGAIAGAALANALGQAGVDTILLKKVSREVHSTRGDLLHPPTLRLLDGLGVLQALRDDGALPITELGLSDRDGLIARYPILAADDGPAGRTLAVPHDRIEAVLYACAERRASVRCIRGTALGLLREDGRVSGVAFRAHASSERRDLRARVVVGCDGTPSLVRRELGISAEQHPYDHEQVLVAGEGETELPAALHWYVDDIGPLAVASRPRHCLRLLMVFPLGRRGDLLRRPDPALHDYVDARFPRLRGLRFGRADAHVYRVFRHVADRFWAPGAALVGDSAHTTHPAGATGMSLAITGAQRLAAALAPALASGTAAQIDAVLEAYDAERRPAAVAAVASNHQQALKLWQSDLYRDPKAYAKAVDPTGSWGAGGAGWGQDPAALSLVAATGVGS